ncbi:hypothetical protein LTR50_001614 [Elasticomyces elasticus]|nr:hypothetical protein LTR50_001614 [Elasticomyces elasticus]
MTLANSNPHNPPGVGVGDATASPTAALLLSILQESTGRVATILFAHRLGTSLEPECKMYRLAADVFNDAAMLLDCLSPAFPKPARVAVLSASSVLRALCGVAAGSAKASLSAHFATGGNLGELNAKDSSQETVISLLGMLAGSVVVSWVTTPLSTWTTLVLLLAIHLGTNHAAVRAVSMDTLNRQRANIVCSHMLARQTVLTPRQVSRVERIFERDGVLRWCDGEVLGYCRIGVSFGTLLGCFGRAHDKTRSRHVSSAPLSALLDVFDKEPYIMWFDLPAGTAYIVLRQGCSPQSQIEAWCHALLVARNLSGADKTGADAELASEETCIGTIRDTLPAVHAALETYGPRLRDVGWNLDVASLETHSGCRVSLSRPREGEQ